MLRANLTLQLNLMVRTLSGRRNVKKVHITSCTFTIVLLIVTKSKKESRSGASGGTQQAAGAGKKYSAAILTDAGQY